MNIVAIYVEYMNLFYCNIAANTVYTGQLFWHFLHYSINMHSNDKYSGYSR